MMQPCATFSNSLHVFMDKPMYNIKFLSVNSHIENVSGLQGDSSLLELVYFAKKSASDSK